MYRNCRMLVQPRRLTSTHSRMAWSTDTESNTLNVQFVYNRLSYTREGWEGEIKRERVRPTAHTHRTPDALCNRIAQIEPVSSQPTRNVTFGESTPTTPKWKWARKAQQQWDEMTNTRTRTPLLAPFTLTVSTCYPHALYTRMKAGRGRTTRFEEITYTRMTP